MDWGRRQIDGGASLSTVASALPQNRGEDGARRNGFAHCAFDARAGILSYDQEITPPFAAKGKLRIMEKGLE